MHIIGTDTGNGVWLIAVHINQSLKAVLLATVKQPVDRAFLINLAMIFIKIIQEIIPNYIFRLTFAAQCIGNESQVFIQCIFTVNSFHKFHKQTNNIILEVFIVANRDNVILISSKRSILTGIPFASCIRKSIYIKRIATKHTSNGIGNQAFDVTLQVTLSYGYISIWNFCTYFVRQPIHFRIEFV